ncbi:hypothetical protein BON89_04965 [Escherichia coli]|nr:hypothetical protein DXB07_12950 [Escherichia coli]TFA39288.1 hypothetical protein BON89_04965 [Escherichia coli]
MKHIKQFLIYNPSQLLVNTSDNTDSASYSVSSFHVNCLDINIQNMNIKNQYIILNYLYIFLFFSANIHVMNNYHHKPPHQHLIIHMIVTIKFIK